MQDKENSGFKNIISHFMNYVTNLSKRNIMMDIGGTAKNQFFYNIPGRSGGFKMNQRKEQALSRRRNMKSSAR